jgi:RNA polymerase-binding protein DksA
MEGSKKMKKEKSRFTEKELNYFQKLILEKRKEANEELQRLRDRISGNNDESVDNDSTYSFHLADSASISTEREDVYRMIDRLDRYIGYLDRALNRIKNKTYGICRITGKPIQKERLKAIPHTELSVEGKNLEKQQGTIPVDEEMIL